MDKKSVEILKTLFGKNGEEFPQKIETLRPEFAELLDEFALQRVWGREGLPLREKSLLTIASQIGLGRWDQVELHMKSFLFHLGGTEKDLSDALIHLSLYCGFPAAVAGYRILDKLTKKGGRYRLSSMVNFSS